MFYILVRWGEWALFSAFSRITLWNPVSWSQNWSSWGKNKKNFKIDLCKPKNVKNTSHSWHQRHFFFIFRNFKWTMQCRDMRFFALAGEVLKLVPFTHNFFCQTTPPHQKSKKPMSETSMFILFLIYPRSLCYFIKRREGRYVIG